MRSMHINYSYSGSRFWLSVASLLLSISGWPMIRKFGLPFKRTVGNQARRPLFEYLQHGGRDPESPYIFTSQRNQQLTEAGIHHWFRALKQQVSKDQWEKVVEP